MIDTRRTRRASGRVFRGDSRATGGIRVVCGSLGTRGATEGIREKLSLADLAAHSGLAGGIRDSPGVSLGTRGYSEGSRG